MAWNKCQECGGDLVETPGKPPYEEAKCVKCGTLHGWNHDDGWYSLGKDEKESK